MVVYFRFNVKKTHRVGLFGLILVCYYRMMQIYGNNLNFSNHFPIFL